MKIIYDMPYFKEIIVFFAVPLLVVLLSFCIGLDIYSIKTKNKDAHYNYIMNFYSLLMAVIVCAFLTALSFGFSISFIKSLIEKNLVEQYKFLYYFGFAFPILPIVSLVFFMIKFYKNHKEKKHRYTIDNIKILDDKVKNNNDDEIEVL